MKKKPKFKRGKIRKPSNYKLPKKDIEPSKNIRLKKTKKGIVQVDKIDLFMEEMLKNGGNATKAAMKVWNPGTYKSASVMGSNALKKARGMARIHMEERGYGYGKMLDVAIDKLDKAKKPDWWDRLMKMADYEDFTTSKRTTPAVAVNVFQEHKKIASAYIEGEAEEIEEVLPDEDKL